MDSTPDVFARITGSAGESASYLARLGYGVGEIRDALMKRFAVDDDLASTIATEAVTRSKMVNTDEPRDSGGPHGTT